MTGYAGGKIALAICDRCHLQYPYSRLSADGNSPGLRVCDTGCWDSIDPYRLPKRSPEPLTMQFPRPEVPLNADPLGLVDDTQTAFIVTDDTEGYIKP